MPLLKAETDTQPQIWAGKQPGASLCSLCRASCIFSSLPMWTKGGQAPGEPAGGLAGQHSQTNTMTVSDALTQVHTLGPDSVLSCEPKMCLLSRGKCVYKSNCLHLCTQPTRPRRSGGCTSGLASSRCSCLGLPSFSSHPPASQKQLPVHLG